MRINKVIATDCQTKERQIFTFGTAQQGKRIVTARGGKLNNYMEFCFKEEVDCVKDVEVEFVINDELFSLSRLHNDDGTSRTVLKKMTDGHWQVVARAKSVQYLESILNDQFANILTTDYVNNISVNNFHGNLLAFEQVRMLAEVQDSVEKSTQQANDMRRDALAKVKAYGNAPAANTQKLDQINADLAGVARDIALATAQLGELRAKQSMDVLRLDIAAQLEDTQQKYNALTAQQSEIDDARAKVKLRDDIELLVPKMRTLRLVAEQRAEQERKRYAITSELEWQENELASINAQLEEKNRQFAASQDKRNRIEAINNELTYIASLYEKNKKLNEQLLELNDKQQRLVSEKVMYANKLDLVESSIADVRGSLDAFKIPAKSVGELLETVRIDVKIDEVTAQIEKLQSEIAVKESQIAEKESHLVVQVKRFRSVAELDVAVTPIKAKDTILQVLEAKHAKLETVNLSLQEKLRNLQRASEDYKFRILQLEQSRSKLEQQRDKLLLRKQEEFKREVFLNSQKVYSEDTSSVFAVTANFHDQEMDALDQEIAARNMDRDLLMERAYQLDGAIKEIKRHIEINNAEMQSLQREKANINKRYNEIVAANSSEAVFNYLKALNSDNGTKYLLDVQQDAVRSEAELAELKRATESLRAKVTALKSRLKYLQETQQQLDANHTSVDTLVSTNDKLKDELADIGDRLAAGYEQYKAISRQLESIDSKLDDVRASIVEITKTIKVNEAQIAQSTAKAQQYAGSDDIEQAIANFKYELGDVESERQMLVESKQALEKELFKKRLELEKAQWLFDTKKKEYDELFQELQFEFNLRGLNVDTIEKMDIDSNVEDLRRLVTQYDLTRTSLAEKIQNLYAILQNRPAQAVSAETIAYKEKELALLEERQTLLENQRAEQMQLFLTANTARMRVTAAAAEARALTSVKDTIAQNSIIGLLIKDKIKSILAVSTQYLLAFVPEGYILGQDNFVVNATLNGETIAYDDLPDNIKTAVYVSLILSIPHVDSTDGRWLIFEERINIDKKVLADMLLNIDNISYVVDVTKEAPKVVAHKEEDEPAPQAAATVAE